MILVLVIGLLIPLTAFAATDSAAETTQKTAQAIITSVNMGLGLLQMILWPLIWLAGKLLTNDMIFGNGVEDKLRDIWQDIRNLVNLGFVVILLVIAFSNILGLGQENKYAIKKALPKFVAALLLVNFSFFGVKVVLDVTNIATVALIGISGEKIKESAKWPPPGLDTTKDYDFHTAAGTTTTAKVTDKTFTGNDIIRATAEIQICNPVKDKSENTSETMGRELFCETMADENGVEKFIGTLTEDAYAALKSIDARNITLYMATNLMNINAVNQLPSVNASSSSSSAEASISGYLNQLIDLGIGVILSIVELFVFGTAIIALVVVLFVRVVVMWNVLVLSPLVALMIFLPESVKTGLDVQKQVVKQAIAPVIIAATMGIGIAVLYGLKGAEIISDLNELKSPSAVFSSLSDIAVIIGAIVVVWKGVETASKDTFGGFIVETVQKNVMDMGKFAGKLATIYTPVTAIESSDGKKTPVSLAALTQSVTRVPGLVEGAVSEQASGLAKTRADDIKKLLGLPVIKTFADALDELSIYVQKGNISPTSVQRPVTEAIGASTGKQDLDNERFRENLASIIEKGNLPGVDRDMAARVRDPKQDIEELINGNPAMQKALFGKEQKVSDVRAEFRERQQTGAAPSLATDMKPKGATLIAKAAGEKGATVESMKRAVEADPEAKALKLTDTQYKQLIGKNQEWIAKVLEQVKKGTDGSVDDADFKHLMEVTELIKKKDGAKLKEMITAGTVTAQQVDQLITAVDDKEVKEDEKAKLKVDAGITAPATPGGQPPPGPPGAPGSPGAAGGPPPVPPTPSPPSP